MVMRLTEEHIDEMLSLQEQCLDNRDLFLPTSREGYLRAFRYMNFCFGYRLSHHSELVAFLNCSMPTSKARINFGRNRLPHDQLDRVGHLNTLLVRKEVRQLGIGSELVEASLREFVRRDCNHIFVTVSTHNKGSIHLLRSMSFSPVDFVSIQSQRRELYYRNLFDGSHPIS